VRVLILPDADFLQREHAMLARLEVGLADEGARVIHAMPRSVDPIDATAVYSTPVSYHDLGLPFTLPLRAAELVRGLPAEGDHPAVDVVYAAGRGAWGMAVEVGRRAGAAVLVEVWSHSLIAPAARLAARVRGGGGRGLLRLLAPDPVLLAALARQVPANQLAEVPWGVHPGEARRGPIDPAASLSIALLASGDDPLAVKAAVEALPAVVAGAPGAMMIADARVAERVPLWKWATAAGVASRVTVIADLEGRRELVLTGDVLLIPEALGDHRSIVLDAMAMGMLVAARPDPMVDWLTGGIHVAPIAEADAEAVSRVLLRLATDAPAAAAQRSSAAALVETRRSGSAHVRALLAVCDAVSAVPGRAGGAGSGAGGGR
jgi:hypothetical protein